MRIVLTALAAASLVLAAAEVPAQTLYKLIDKDGKVTYVDKPPKDYEGKVIRVEIDPKANTATFPKAPARTEGESARKPAAAATAAQNRVREAREKLEAARKAYHDARENPGPNDVTRVGNVGGKSSRPVFSDDYQKRLEGLEQVVRDAEEELRRAESGR